MHRGWGTAGEPGWCKRKYATCIDCVGNNAIHCLEPSTTISCSFDKCEYPYTHNMCNGLWCELNTRRVRRQNNHEERGRVQNIIFEQKVKQSCLVSWLTHFLHRDTNISVPFYICMCERRSSHEQVQISLVNPTLLLYTCFYYNVGVPRPADCRFWASIVGIIQPAILYRTCIDNELVIDTTCR